MNRLPLVRALAFGSLLAAATAHAATTITVTSNANAGASTLRQAIIDANADPSPDPVTIAFAIGTGAVSIAPTTALPAITRRVVIDGTTQPGFDDAPLVEIRGDSMPDGANGLRLQSNSGSTVRGLVINRFTHDTSFNGGYAIDIASGSNDHLIAGNYLGTDATGAAAAANSRGGLRVGGSNVTIGGSTAEDRNVISGSAGVGVLFVGGTGSTVVGNYIGLDAVGTTEILNAQGVSVFTPTADLTVGGAGLGEGNVIASTAWGITVISAAGTVVRGNLFGTDASGTTLAGAAFSAAAFQGVDGATMADNVIGGMTSTGIFVQGESHDVVIQGNHIGIDASGTVALPITGYGIAVQGDSPSPTDVTIGGTGVGEGNVITNCTAGVQASGGTTFPVGITIRGNSITGNSQLGIALGGNVTPNDTDDTDDGPNGLQNFPELTTAGASATDVTIDGALTSLPSATYTVDFYASAAADPSGFGEGATYLGSTSVPIDGTGTATFSVTLPVVVTPGAVITATATDADGNTSEFSEALTSTAASTTSTSTTTSSTTTSSTTTSSTTSSSTTTSSIPTSTTTSSTTTTSTAPTTSTTSTTLASSTTSTSSTSTSSTTTAPPSTTSTTLPCDVVGVAQVVCLLEDVPPATCTGESLPKGVTKGLDAARTALGKVPTASAKAARRLEKAAAARLKKASAKLAKAAKQNKVSAICATELGASIEQLRVLIAALLAG
jgi:hypothetical protein